MSLNPLVEASDPAVVDVGHLLYRSLLKLDSTGYPTDDLAASCVGQRQRARVHGCAASRTSSGPTARRSPPDDVVATDAVRALAAGE